jgi:hypothetical protein
LDPVTQNAPAITPAAIDPVTPAVPPGAAPSGNPVSVDITSDKLASRFAEEREKARQKLLKDFGFDKADDLKAVLTAARELQDKNLTEQQRALKTIEELKPRADRATALEQRVAAFAKRELDALPEAARNAVTKHAGEDPDKVLATIEMFRDAGLIGAQAATPAAPEPPKPATSAAPANAPKPASGRSKFDDWKAKSGMAADIFYSLNQAEIERSRPAGQ